jgi:uncharacterized protein (DUF1778 family)
MAVDSSMDVEAVRPVARNRPRTSGRPHRVHVRLTSEEQDDIRAAAARAGLNPTAYAGVTAVAAARALVADSSAGATRAELAAVQREVFAARSALVQAVQVSPGGQDAGVGEAGAAMVGRLDAIAERLHGLLKRASS